MIKSNNNSSSSSKDTSQLLFLSLFLLLVAFFILLNSLATIEEARSRKVLSSVAAAFRIVAGPNNDSPMAIADLGPVARPEPLMDAMARLWATSVSIQDVRTLTPGRIMQVTMPANELFLGGSAELRRDRQGLFESLARPLAVHSDGFAHEIEFAHGRNGADGGISVRRAVALAQTLVARGTPDDVVSVGLREGNPKLIRMRFMFRPDNEAHLTFRELLH